MFEVPDYDWSPVLQCLRHEMRMALCDDGQYRCLMCTTDRLVRLSFVKKGS